MVSAPHQELTVLVQVLGLEEGELLEEEEVVVREAKEEELATMVKGD